MQTRFFPFLEWFKTFNLERLRRDAFAGLTVALVLIPQSVAYAKLAGLPAYYGLYASFLPPIIAGMFGSSAQLSTGPVAVVSLMTAASLEHLAAAGSEGYIAYAILLAVMVGTFQFALGVLKLGLLVNFLSRPVVHGFTAAAALIIATSQLSGLFGVTVDNAEHHYETVIRIFRAAWHYTHLNTLLIGILAFVIMYGLRRISRKIPNVLAAVIVTTLISYAVGFEHNITADISSVQSDEAVQLIKDFNQITKAIPPLSRKRAGAMHTAEEAKNAQDTIAMLGAKCDAEGFATAIQRFKYEAYVCREKIRGFLFGRVEEADGSVKFYLRDAPHSHGLSFSDDNIWRIRIGKTPLDTKKLLMTGGGAVIGSVPSGLPPLSVPEIDLNIMQKLLSYALIIALLGFMEAISVAKAMSAETGQPIDPNQELIGQGLANIGGAFTGSYTVSGSLSRSAVNLEAGAVSGLSGVFTGLTVLITLLFFTPLLYHLPQSVLSAIIITAVMGLVDIRSFQHAWKTQWYDGVIAVITFVSTLMFAPHLDKGIMVGVFLSLSVFLYKSMRPTVVDLSLYIDKSLHDAASHGLRECKYIDVVRFDGPLFFANASYLEEQITERRTSKKELRHIIIVSNGINDIDASGEESLSLVADRVRSAGIDISLSGVNGAVMRVLERTGLAEKIGTDHIYPTTEEAIDAIYEQIHTNKEEEFCPLKSVCRK